MNKRFRLLCLVSLFLAFISIDFIFAEQPDVQSEKESLQEAPPPQAADLNAPFKTNSAPELSSNTATNEAPKVAPDEKNNNKSKDKKNDDKDKKNGKGNGKDDKENDGKPHKAPLIFSSADSELKFSVKLRMPEFFYGKNLRLLNDLNPTDRVVFFRHTLDFNTEYSYGPPTTEYNLAYVKMTIRNRGIWGDPESIALTTMAPIKELDTSFGEHRHAIPRHILWIRELWMQLSLNEILCLPFCNHHSFTLGAFAFELGEVSL